MLSGKYIKINPNSEKLNDLQIFGNVDFDDIMFSVEERKCIVSTFTLNNWKQYLGFNACGPFCFTYIGSHLVLVQEPGTYVDNQIKCVFDTFTEIVNENVSK